jgi:hypothetical protein
MNWHLVLAITAVVIGVGIGGTLARRFMMGGVPVAMSASPPTQPLVGMAA